MNKFSIIVVALNAGDKLIETIQSIEAQTFTDYEVVVKDGGSKDGSIDMLREYLSGKPEFSHRVNIFEQPDKSIYEGMNQAVSHSTGEYFYFLNCGDYFYSNETLFEVSCHVNGEKNIFYGDIFDALRDERVTSNPKIDSFACYRNVPCHQSCFYHRDLFSNRGYEPKYRVRADYEHFLWCFFIEKIRPVHMDVIIASYEGAGFSETSENKKKSKTEHKEITKKYMSGFELFKYKTILLLTLQPLRTFMAESKTFSGFYNGIKRGIYKLLGK